MKRRTIVVSCVFLMVFICAVSGQGQQSKANYTIYEVGGDVRAPKPINTAIPAPPANVDKDRKVRLSFVVMPDGSVDRVKLLKRSKSDFDNFAIDVVSKWKFEPATKNGYAVAVRLEADVRSHK